MDTNGFYALLVKRDDKHAEASRILKSVAQKQRGVVTTDYVLDETATLFQARGCRHLLQNSFDAVFASAACQVEWTDKGHFHAVKGPFLKHSDQHLSRVARTEGKVTPASSANHDLITESGGVGVLHVNAVKISGKIKKLGSQRSVVSARSGDLRRTRVGQTSHNSQLGSRPDVSVETLTRQLPALEGMQ